MKEMLAICWMGHRATNEMKAIYLMNKARNYPEFVDAIMNFQCPAQNMAYADRAGNIAMWGQGQFINKWKEQGKYVMNGSDSSTLWGQLIPMRENPHVLNPSQGYVSSANQQPTDSTYPYWYNGSGFVNLRAWRLNQVLDKMHNATIDSMFGLQNDVYSELAEMSLPKMLRSLVWPSFKITPRTNCIHKLEDWDYNLRAQSDTATMFQLWYPIFSTEFWKGFYPELNNSSMMPLQERLAQLLGAYEFRNREKLTPEENKLMLLAIKSLQVMDDSIVNLQAKAKSNGEWYEVKNTTVAHLTKLPAFSYDHMKIGGWGNTLNAAKGDHGPSWRMVVQMGKEIEAYGVYPGGQSGNPGSKYYADFLQQWADGKYYRLLFLPNADKQHNSGIKYIWSVKALKN
jgi:penicillin amidase